MKNQQFLIRCTSAGTGQFVGYLRDDLTPVPQKKWAARWSSKKADREVLLINQYGKWTAEKVKSE